MQYEKDTYRLTDGGKISNGALLTGIIFLAISALGLLADKSQFFHSYLVAFLFWTSVALGGLFFTMVNHVLGTQWSIVLRRIGETTLIVLPVLAILFIPLIFGIHDIYHWSHAEEVVKDHLLQKKADYLNSGFFVSRTIIYFVIWILFGRSLYRLSLKQDNDPNEGIVTRMRNISAPGLVLYALTVTFAAFDWLMSLNPHWYSTIFGLYFFSGCFLAILSFLVLFGQFLKSNNVLNETITVEHYHDLAKLLFGFTIFWGYMGFSQYFLIWYANIPEETIWYLVRWEGNWKYITMTIVFGHFLIPFLGLMTRASKRSGPWLIFISIWILVMHWIDIYWMVFPTHSPEGFFLSWMDLSLFIGLGALFFWIFWRKFILHPMIPAKDYRFPLSLVFKNN